MLPSVGILDSSKPHLFALPTKKIASGDDLSRFLVSQAYRDIITFLMQLNHSMFPASGSQNHPSARLFRVYPLEGAKKECSATLGQLRELLNALNGLIDEVPLDKGPRRFGNMSFRKWHEILETRATALLEQNLPISVTDFKHGSITPLDELRAYFLGSFGSSQRLDFGTGHELSFLAFLCSIWKLGGFGSAPNEDDLRGIVLGVIQPYLSLVRRLIQTYTLEPAGSHGVWGLDDHSFLPYIFGSAQYGPPIKPEDPTPVEGSVAGAPEPATVSDFSAVEQERDQNMYFGAIGFIFDVKKGPFWEHSPTLYDISGVRAGWGKINKGMMKMYDAEVLGKFPVVQHFPFGSLFSWDRDQDARLPATTAHSISQPRSETLKPTSATAGPELGDGNTRAPWIRDTSSPTQGSSSQNPQLRNAHQKSPMDGNPSVVRKGETRVEDEKNKKDAMLPPTRAPWAK